MNFSLSFRHFHCLIQAPFLVLSVYLEYICPLYAKHLVDSQILDSVSYKRWLQNVASISSYFKFVFYNVYFCPGSQVDKTVDLKSNVIVSEDFNMFINFTNFGRIPYIHAYITTHITIVQ